MDLVAANPLIMRTGFIQLGIIVIFAIVAGIKRSPSHHPGMIWLKLNAPITSIVLGELWALAAWILFHAVPAVDDYFIVGLWLAGGSGLVSSLVKDAADGSMKTASLEGVVEMRQVNEKKGGIG